MTVRPADVVAVPSLRERLIAAAVRRTLDKGWGSITMAKLADDVGVSRQTVYNEFGNKAGLAEAIAMSELTAFMDVVDAAFRDHPSDLIAGVRQAVRSVLEFGQDNPVVRAALTARSGTETADLLPLLTTHSEPLLDVARQLIHEHVSRYEIDLPDARLDQLIDGVVRLALSHVVRPGGEPDEIAETIAWLAERVLP